MHQEAQPLNGAANDDNFGAIPRRQRNAIVGWFEWLGGSLYTLFRTIFAWCVIVVLIQVEYPLSGPSLCAAAGHQLWSLRSALRASLLLDGLSCSSPGPGTSHTSRRWRNPRLEHLEHLCTTGFFGESTFFFLALRYRLQLRGRYVQIYVPACAPWPP